MTPVPQAAVDALRAAEEAHTFEPYLGMCRCGYGAGLPWEHHKHRSEHLAAAVVAAVQGPIKAEAELDLLAQIVEWFDVGCWVDADDVRHEFHRRRAERIEAQP